MFLELLRDLLRPLIQRGLVMCWYLTFDLVLSNSTCPWTMFLKLLSIYSILKVSVDHLRWDIINVLVCILPKKNWLKRKEINNITTLKLRSLMQKKNFMCISNELHRDSCDFSIEQRIYFSSLTTELLKSILFLRIVMYY